MRFVKEAGCDAVKLEGGGETPVARARAIVRAGIPVMGHVGLTPQTSTALGGYKAQGRSARPRRTIAREALALQEVGCFSLVFEAIPSAVAAELMPHMDDSRHRHRRGPVGRRPGAGVPRPARHPRGPRRALRQALREPARRDDAGVAAFADEVRDRTYPGPSTATRSTSPSSRTSAPRWPSTIRASHTPSEPGETAGNSPVAACTALVPGGRSLRDRARPPEGPMASLIDRIVARDREFYEYFEVARRLRRRRAARPDARALPRPARRALRRDRRV